MGSGLVEVISLPELRLAHWGSLLVQDWRGQPFLRDYQRLGEAYREIIARYPEGISSLGLVRLDRQLGSPEAGIREEARKQFVEFDRHTVASAVVFDGGGFSARTVRTFVRAVLLFAQPKAPHKVFAELDPAVDWMSGIDERMASEQGLSAMIRSWWEQPSPELSVRSKAG